jgi:hypothetical protein
MYAERGGGDGTFSGGPLRAAASAIGPRSDRREGENEC